MTNQVETMFQTASRKKLRYNNFGGQLAVEDLWDMKLTGVVSLDELAKQLKRAIKDSSEESFVVKKSTANEILQLKFDLVLHVIGVLMEEREKKANDVARKEQKQKILAIMERKQDQSLENMSMEELQKLIQD